MSNIGWAAVILALVIIAAGGWWYMSQQLQTQTPANTTTGTPTPDNDMVGGDASVDVGVGDASTRVEVRYTASGFSPATVTVARGTAVTFINDTSSSMWVASKEHPTHTQYDGSDRTMHCAGSYAGATPFDQCQAGSSYTFVFDKAGSFGYHNHFAPSNGGTVVVQ